MRHVPDSLTATVLQSDIKMTYRMSGQSRGTPEGMSLRRRNRDSLFLWKSLSRKKLTVFRPGFFQPATQTVFWLVTQSLENKDCVTFFRLRCDNKVSKFHFYVLLAFKISTAFFITNLLFCEYQKFILLLHVVCMDDPLCVIFLQPPLDQLSLVLR